MFFGPDSYRFVRFIRQKMPELRLRRNVVDMGSGVESAESLAPALRETTASRLWMSTTRHCDWRDQRRLRGRRGSNLEVKADSERRRSIRRQSTIYDGHCATCVSRWAAAKGGEVALVGRSRLLTSSHGWRDVTLHSAAASRSSATALRSSKLASTRELRSFEEIDSDVFGEELEDSSYACVERIAALVQSKRPVVQRVSF